MLQKRVLIGLSLSILNGLSCSTASHKLLVAHRGASAYAPEHTLEAYRLAIEQGADYVEQDLQITRDGVLICMHDASLERTTNVEDLFADRAGPPGSADEPKRWWIVDFTLEEIKTLDAGSWFDERFQGLRVPTFQEAIAEVGNQAGLFPEIKDPDFYAERGFDMVQIFLRELDRAGLQNDPKTHEARVIVQSFSASSLQELAHIGCPWPRVLLVSRDSQEWLTAAGIARAAVFATGLGPEKDLVLEDPSVVGHAHQKGLSVIPYTFRSSRVGDDFESVSAEMRYYLEKLGVDGLFTDNPDLFPR